MPAAVAELLKRLDDSSDGVRIGACRALAVALARPAADVDVGLLRTLAVHLDDAERAVRDAVGGVLLACAAREPGLVAAELPDACRLHKSKDLCTRVLAACRQP